MTQDSLAKNHPGYGHVAETAPLTPMSLDVLLNRVAHEFETRNRIFDLPTGRIWQADPEVDLSFEFLGRPVATPIGPAAGPHSQLTQNIVLSWLGGSRLFELKTVQILDQLEIARPCIDMQTVGYNIEWSQELTLEQSLTEYVKASMMLEILQQWQPLAPHVGDNSGPYVFDMSVGYDLAGISNDRVAAFIKGMANAADEVEALRSEIPEPFASFADFDFSTSIADTLTLSTFHGCPPHEISQITKHLIDVHDLDVIVKLNPTLLGYETVASIVNDQLGYSDVAVKAEAFDEDLQFDQGLVLIDELHDYAVQRGRRFGIKLTNTLVVHNAKQWMPEDTMYLSGPPLHVLASTLLDKLATALPGRFDIPGHDGDIMVSYSAGVNKGNLSDLVATGVNPATVCSDLLKPGGYGRLAPMLKSLTSDVREANCTSLKEFRGRHQHEATSEGFDSTAARYAGELLGEKAELYRFSANQKLPREVDNKLEMFGCVACNLCVTVCPNDAFFSIPTSEDASFTDISGRQQYLVWAELCNECGNCMTFCPEDGDPAMIKPRLFTNSEVFEGRSGQGFLLTDQGIVSRPAESKTTNGRVTTLLTSSEGSPLSPLLDVAQPTNTQGEPNPNGSP